MALSTAALVVVATAVPIPALAQDVGDLELVADDVVHVWSAPARLDGRSAAGLAAVVSGVGLTALADEPIQDWVERHEAGPAFRLLDPFREGGPLEPLGHTYALAPISALLYGWGWAADHRGLREAGMGCLASNLSTSLARGATTRLVGRARPLVGRGPYHFDPPAFRDWGFQAFPGGHASNAMSCASFWAHRFELGAGEPALYALAAAMGLARIVDGAHWASDTVMGLAWGWAVGRSVAGRSLDRLEVREAARREASWPRVRLGWSFRVGGG